RGDESGLLRSRVHVSDRRRHIGPGDRRPGGHAVRGARLGRDAGRGHRLPRPAAGAQRDQARPAGGRGAPLASRVPDPVTAEAKGEDRAMMLTRRRLLDSTAVGMTAFLLPPWLRSARAAGTDPILVSIFQRGAADGLNTVVPAGDPFYYSSRPTIQVAPGTELPLDSFFGLNPAFGDLLGPYTSGDLCFLHAAGSPDPSRSHFDAQDFMDRAAPGNKSIVDGWLNRYLGVVGLSDPIAGISVSNSTAKSLAGGAPSLAFESIAGFTLTGNWATERRAALDVRYSLLGGTPIGDKVIDAFEAIDLVDSV